jgi:cytochrome c-type biogenesis protein CcsB
MKLSLLKKSTDTLFSYWTMLSMFVLLGMGAAIATFIENDYGVSTARVLVYNHLWYEIVLTISILNLSGIMIKRKMYKKINGRFIFHLSFVIMLIGASMTRYIGYEGIMQIREGATQSSMISLEPYIQATITQADKSTTKEFQKEFSAIGDNSFFYQIPFSSKILNISLEDYTFAKKQNNTMNLITTKVEFDGQIQTVKLVGQRGGLGRVVEVNFKDDIKVKLTYGSKYLTVPFAIRLNDFQLDRYPGSMSPSSYASEITLIDKINNVKFDYRIFMNSTLKYGDYQFFQSSYDSDEKGTVLSVNNDPGTLPTYFAYFLLTLGLLMNMFDKQSRFFKLTQYIKKFNMMIVLVALTTLINTQVQANEKLEQVQYLKDYKIKSIETADLFGQLVTQSNMGRMKPLDTLNKEIVQKLTRKSSFLGLNANQIVLGMMSKPKFWSDVKMLKITTPKLKKLLGISQDRKYLSFSEVFGEDGYKLAKESTEANSMEPNKRGTFEKDILKFDERVSIAYQVFGGMLFNIFPQPKDGHNHSNSNKWHAPMDAIKLFHDKDKEVVTTMTKGFISNSSIDNFDEANKFIGFIKMYQQKIGADIIPSEDIIESEILFNNLNIFPKLTLAYVIIGLILFIVAFITVFNKNLHSNKLNTIIFIILFALFTIQTFGMGMRWYISGHAPWSDTYESLVYIAWSAMFAGLFFFRKSLMALSATVVMAGVFMFTAHLSGIDPQITNLVPVLKSYWLTIHVSIITGSYGFLAIGAMLGFMALLLFIVRSESRPHIDDTIKQITAINEAALIVGLAMLIVGNFIGGVWANESWGRYWGWDPKETWAYVSIVVYAIVLHIRFITKLNSPFIFASFSTLAFSSILMTYFGVNFYLSGMHSYATGDPVPIPTWVYILTILVFSVIALASKKRDLPKLKI